MLMSQAPLASFACCICKKDPAAVINVTPLFGGGMCYPCRDIWEKSPEGKEASHLTTEFFSAYRKLISQCSEKVTSG